MRANRAVALALTSLALTACDRFAPGAAGESDATPAAAAPPVPVEVAPISLADLRRTVTGSTTLESTIEVAAVARTPGTVIEIGAQLGDLVTSGQLLARIHNPDAATLLREAENAVARLDREVDAMRPLFDSGYLSRQAFDELLFQRDTARTSLDRARQAAAEQSVRAPLTGAVIFRGVEIGQSVLPNQELFRIATTEHLRAVIAVPERELLNLRTGQDAEVTVDALADRVLPGTVAHIEPTVDPRSGTVRVRIDLLSSPEIEPGLRLRPGMFVTARIVTDLHAGVPAVPRRALMYEGDEPSVFVLRSPGESHDESGAQPLTAWTVERVSLRLGYEDDDLAEVLHGLSAGDRVVTIGWNGLDPDALVVVPADADGSR